MMVLRYPSHTVVSSFPRTSILETFSSAGGPPPGANWSSSIWPGGLPEYGGSGIIASGGVGVGSQSSGYNSALYSTVFNADCEVYATAIYLAGFKRLRLFLRLDGGVGTSSVGGYMADFLYRDGTAGELNIRVLEFGSTTDLTGIVGFTFTNGDRLGFEAIGSTLKAYRNTTAIATVSDTTISSAGRIGFSIEAQSFQIDDFGGGSI